MPLSQELHAVLFTVSVLIFVHLFRSYRRNVASNPKRLPYPPGPKRLPVVGNLLEVPLEYPWLTYMEWAKKYGDIIYTSAFGQEVIILSSPEAVTDILEKRSLNYSDRPLMPMAVDLMGLGWLFAMMNYTPEWRQQRKIFHRNFNQTVSQRYTVLFTEHARKCLLRILDKPNDVLNHLTHYLASSVFHVTDGLDVKEDNDPYLSTALEVILGGSFVGVPGAFLVDVFPILKYIPPWFPGAGFKKVANYYCSLQDPVRNEPVKAVQNAMQTGDHRKSMVSELLSRLQDGTLDTVDSVNQDMFQVTKDIASSAALDDGGAEDAYTEIVRIIGRDRLPEFHEVDAIPYVHALVKELLRWQPVGPLGFPHANGEHDEYRGYYIPKGSTIIPNVWAILHDEKAYSDPYAFCPENFLTIDGTLRTDIRDPADYIFGFGRRICPGRHYAYNNILVIIAYFIIAFEVKPDEERPLRNLTEARRVKAVVL